MNPKILILCGGNGTRIQTVVKHKLKPMIKVGGIPILQRLVEYAKTFGITDISVNLHRDPDQIIEYFGDSLNYYYEPNLLGTAGTIRNIGKYLGEDFIVLNGDTITNLNLRDLYLHHLRNKITGTLITKSVDLETGHGTGAYVVSYKALKMLPSNGLIDDALKNIPLTIIASSYVKYYDCGTPKGLARARRHIKNG